MTSLPLHRLLGQTSGNPGPIITLDGQVISEAAAIGDVVGELAVVGGSGSYTFEVTGGTGSALFAVDGDFLEVAATLDFATLPAPTVEITADNGEDDPISRTFTITVTDFIPPESPTDNDGGVEDIPGLVGVYLFDPAYLFQDAAGETPVTASGQRVGRIVPAYGDGPALIQGDNAFSRPTYTESGGARFGLFSTDGTYLEADSLDIFGFSDLYFVALIRATATSSNQTISTLSVPGSFPWNSADGCILLQRQLTNATWVTAHNFQGTSTIDLANDTDGMVESIWTDDSVTLALDGTPDGTPGSLTDFAPDASRWVIGAGSTQDGAGGVEFHAGRIYGFALVTGAPVSDDHRALIRDTIMAASGL